MRADRWLLLLPLLAACGPMAVMTRPEGNGGWTAEQRRDELAKRAASAGVDLDATAPALPTDRPLSLSEAIALAAGGNRRILEAEHMLGEAGARVRLSRGRLLPNVTGEGRYTWYTDPLSNQVDFPPGVLPAGITPPIVIIREQESGRVNGTVRVPLDVTGELWKGLTAAQAGYRGERARVWATTLAEQVAVIRAYFELLEAQRLRVVTTERIAVQRTQLTNAQNRFDSGRLTKNELLVVQVALRDSEQGLRRRDLAIAEARWSLNQLIGRPVDAPTEVVDVATPPVLPSTEDALRDAFANNPLLLSLAEEQQRLDDTTSSLERGRLPRFNAGGAIDWTSEKIITPQRVGAGFVGFTWDIGTDGQREARIAEARIAADRNRIAVERELRSLETGVRATQQAAEERLSALESAGEAVTQAEENLRIRQQQFDAGRATSEDVLDAEALLTRQRADLATALYQAHTRRAELQQLMGLPLDGLAAATR
ncbi:MAG TPA: TolC family protein [Candidatus Binatia bacterium]|nr:TolC family protein [Candidatus Binatia bacterium]